MSQTLAPTAARAAASGFKAVAGAPSGVWAAALTAFDENGALNVQATLRHWRWLLEDGACDGLVPFGTTGEGTSMSLDERLGLLSAAAEAGLPPERLWPATAANGLPDALALARHARALGHKGVLALPPFFYPAAHEGLLAWYAGLFRELERDGSDFGVLLYHIPKLSRAPITQALTADLSERFGAQLRGLKDSDGAWENMDATRRNFPHLALLGGDESLALRLADAGGAGVILARACAAGPLLQRFAAQAAAPDRRAEAEKTQDFLSALRVLCVSHGSVPALKYLTGRAAPGAWFVRPPLRDLDEAQGAALVREIAALGPDGNAVLEHCAGP